MELNEKIKALRSERGLTQKEIAAAVGVSDKTISKWECGRGGISLKEALKLSEALGAHIDDLLPVKAVEDKAFLSRKIQASPFAVTALALTAAFAAVALIWMAIFSARASDDSLITGWLHVFVAVILTAAVFVIFSARLRSDSVVASGFGKRGAQEIRSVYNLKKAYKLAGETVSLAACVFNAAQFLGVAFIASGVAYAISVALRIAVLVSGFASAAAFYYVKFAKIRRDENIIRAALARDDKN